jgi:hypothetical protein
VSVSSRAFRTDGVCTGSQALEVSRLALGRPDVDSLLRALRLAPSRAVSWMTGSPSSSPRWWYAPSAFFRASGQQGGRSGIENFRENTDPAQRPDASRSTEEMLGQRGAREGGSIDDE